MIKQPAVFLTVTVPTYYPIAKSEFIKQCCPHIVNLLAYLRSLARHVFNWFYFKTTGLVYLRDKDGGQRNILSGLGLAVTVCAGS
jgi:hypothetical protein